MLYVVYQVMFCVRNKLVSHREQNPAVVPTNSFLQGNKNEEKEEQNPFPLFFFTEQLWVGNVV